MEYLRVQKYTGIDKTANGYIIHADTADVMLVFMTEDIVRIRVAFDKEFKEASYALVRTAWEDQLDALFADERVRVDALDVPYTEDERSLHFATGTMTLTLIKEPFMFTLRTPDGRLVYSDLKNRAYERDNMGRPTHYSRIYYDNDHFYGFGEKSGELDKKCCRMRMNPKDSCGLDPQWGDPMYKHVPFYIRTNDVTHYAVGLFYNNSYDCVFDMGNELSGYWDRYCYYQTDGGDIDLFLINGPRPADVTERFTWLVGTTILPTKQSLGFCDSTMYYAELPADCDKAIYQVIDQHERAGINIDNFWLASGYSSGEEDNLRYTFNWNYKRFPNPKEFFNRMNERGINVIPNTKPGILENHPYRHVFEENNAFIKEADGKTDYVGRWWGGPGRFVDFTSKAGRETWKGLLERNVLEMGTKTVWNDNCEFDGIEDRNAVCDKEGLGGTMAELKIIQSNMMAKMAIEAIHDVYPGERPYVINRAGYAGIQRYAQVWAGDNTTLWKTIKYNINTILGMGLSGMANAGCDVGGFQGPAPTEEMFLRWVQNGVLMPRFVINSANNDNTVTQPFMYPDILPEIREAYALRYRLLPYMYSLMWEAHTKGLPLWRPLFMEFPEDSAAYSERSEEFMFGHSILVANVLEEGATTRDVYLPAGADWYDLGDKLRTYKGGQTITIPVDTHSIPMFLRSDAIVVTSPDIHHILSDTMRRIDLLIAADKDSEFTLYDDDGHTEAYKSGEQSITTIKVTGGERVTITFDKTGSYEDTYKEVRLRVVNKVKGAYYVTVDGALIDQFLTEEDYEAASSGWYYDLSDRTVKVKYVRPERDHYTVVTSFERFDLIGNAEFE